MQQQTVASGLRPLRWPSLPLLHNMTLHLRRDRATCSMFSITSKMYSYLLEGQYGRDEMVMFLQVYCSVVACRFGQSQKVRRPCGHSKMTARSSLGLIIFVAVVTPVTLGLIIFVLPSGRPSFYFRVSVARGLLILIFCEERHHQSIATDSSSAKPSKKRQSKQPVLRLQASVSVSWWNFVSKRGSWRRRRARRWCYRL